jgi:hypothetical protein
MWIIRTKFTGKDDTYTFHEESATYIYANICITQIQKITHTLA